MDKAYADGGPIADFEPRMQFDAYLARLRWLKKPLFRNFDKSDVQRRDDLLKWDGKK